MKNLFHYLYLLALVGCSESTSIKVNTPDPAVLQELKNVQVNIASIMVTENLSIEDIAGQTKRFAEQGAVLQKGISSTDSTCQNLSSEIASELSASQAQVFPALRRAYISALRRQAQGSKIKAECAGQECADARFIDSKFTNAQYLTTFKTAHWQPLVALRFHHVLFQWNKGDGEATIDTNAMEDAQVSDRISGN